MQPITAPILPNAKGPEVANLQSALLLLVTQKIIKDSPNKPTAEELARLAIQLQAELLQSAYGKGTTELVNYFQIQQKLGDNLKGVVEEKTAARINELLKALGAFTGNNDPYTVTGKVLNSNGVAMPGVVAELYIKTIDRNLPAGKTETDKEGNYTITFSPNTSIVGAPDIETRAYNKDMPANFGVSETRYNASKSEKLDVVIPAGKLAAPAEFDSLVKDMRANLGQVPINNLKEDRETQHITYLSNKTGWDARAVAMAASAHQLGEQLKINPAHAYAFFRSGIPGDDASIKSLSAAKIEETIKKAIDKNIIPNTGNIQETIKILAAQSVNYVLTTKSTAAVSTMNDMLSLRLNTDQKNIFAETFKLAGNDADKFWTQLQQRGISADTVSKLQLDGKLGYLTGHNAPLVKKVYDSFQVKSDAELATSGLYKTAEWKRIIGTDIPAGLTADEYAGHLASQVKLSYPTTVAAQMINRDEIKLGPNTPKQELFSFFSNNQQKNTIGLQPIKSWDGYQQLSAPAKASAKTFERLYQISPSDQAMTAMAAAGLTAAYQVARYTKTEFMTAYGKIFPNTTQAEQAYTKSAEVYSASLGVATSYITNRSMPNIYAITGKLQKVQEETIAYPTLEELFGNMDYCACDQCKSVLSAAAYLVELLQFIDLGTVPHTKANPIDELLQRRPDIQHIQLTCENTNVALPYIDLVNEILEHYILNGDLVDLKGHDVTEQTKQTDLLAEPQFVEKAAYDELKTKVFPYNLPFHQPLETLRLLFKMWDLSLEVALGIYSTPLAERKEILGFSEDEYKTLTDINFKNLPEYFGEAPAGTIAQLNAAIANGKTFSRRTGISYEDLVDMLKTNFINPGYSLVSLFQALNISLTVLQQYYTGAVSDSQIDGMIPAGTDASKYGGDIKQWLKDNRELIMGLITLTEVGSGSSECNFALVELRYALPDNVNNRLTAIAYHKFHRFIRLLVKTGWTMDILDYLLAVTLPVTADKLTTANIDGAFVTVFNRLANFKKITTVLSLSKNKIPDFLPVLDAGSALALQQEKMAKLLKLTIPDLLELSAITGIDPFAADLETDQPSLLRFITIAKQLKANALKVVDFAYILHHKDDNGKLNPSQDVVLKNMKALRDLMNTVDRENSIAPDNADFNFAKAKMLLVYDPATTDDFFGLLQGTKTFSSPFVTTEEVLPQKITAADVGIGFDGFKKLLTYNGIVSAAAKTALENAADSLVVGDMSVITSAGDLATFVADFKTALQQLTVDSNAALTSFGNSYPELKTVYDAVKAETTPSAQTKKLVDLVLPELVARLKTNSLRQVLPAMIKSDPDSIAVLTGKKEVIHAAADNTKTVLYDFMQLQEKLVFNQNQAYSFFIDVPATDDYLLYVGAPQNTVISLTVNGQVVINNVTVGPSKEIKNAAALSLKTGVLHTVQLSIAALPAAETVQLSWRTKGIAQTPIPGTAMYASSKMDAAKTSFIRLYKASQLQNLLALTPAELDYFAGANTETVNFLNELDTDGTITHPNLVALWKKIALLVDFTAIKKENEPEENTWLQVLLNPDAKNTQGKFLLESFNTWQEADLAAVLANFAITRADISKLSVVKKMMQAMAIIAATNYPAVQVINWINNDPSYDLVAGIKQLVKDTVTEAAYLETMQTVSDPVRNKLRDALVAYILQYKKPSPEIINPDKLYEYFLIDVEMDACMKTSRIRQALSTVQLFIQRCLMNLEPNVDPASIRAEQWVWMKRYRVWEANRKVFLFPENWLEPELRDNKSSLFKELEGELLQAEITDDSAELAFLNYLKKLDDIAKLEMVGMFLEENEKGNQDDDILHVFGRTNGHTRQYYYRRYEYGYWTPWEKMNLNVEGDHLFPIIWKKRLFVFWLSIVEKAVEGDRSKSAQTLSNEQWGNQQKKNAEINICWGEYYKGKWTSPKSTDLKKPMIISNLTAFDPAYLLIYGRKDKVENPVGKFRERLIFNLRYRGGGGGTNVNAVFTFTSKNAAPYLEYTNDSVLYDGVRNDLNVLLLNPYNGTTEYVNFNYSLFSMTSRNFRVNIAQPVGASKTEVTENVLTKKNVLSPGFSVLPARYPTENKWEAPLSYADEHSTFFIQPDESHYLAIWGYKEFYPFYEAPLHYIEPPVIVEKPIKGWPPEEMFKPGTEVILDNPWAWNQETIETNNNFKKMLPVTQTFSFGGTEFGTAGKNIGNKLNF